MDHIAERDRSYDLNHIPSGTALVALRDVAYYGKVMVRKGETVYTIMPTSNAGFNGIELSVTTADGRKVYGVTAGAFRKANTDAPTAKDTMRKYVLKKDGRIVGRLEATSKVAQMLEIEGYTVRPA